MYYLDTAIYKKRIVESKIFNIMGWKDTWYEGLLEKKNKLGQTNFIYKVFKSINDKNIFSDPYYKNLNNIIKDVY